MTPEHDATVALAIELLSRASVTPDDRGCQNLVAERLQACGFQCTSMNFGAVHNLWARRGSQAPLFCFAGHTDVVPPGDESQWRFAPFVPTISDGMLFARGAADMKSSIAAFITAAERFIAAHPDHPGSIALLLTSDEEGPAVDGTVKVVETLARQGIRMDYCLVGEPTSSTILGDMIKNGRRGSLTGILKIHGQQGHVAYPHLARNPIHLFAPALAELTECHWDDGNEFFPPTSFQIVDIHAGQHVSNIIPGSCDVMFNFRFASVSTPEALQKRVAAILDKHRLDWEIDWQLSGRPFLTGRGALVDALQRSITQITGTGAELSTSGGTSDGRFIADICDQVVEFGPVNATIHKVNEYIAVKDIAGLSAIYEKTLQTLLSPTTHSI